MTKAKNEYKLAWLAFVEHEKKTNILKQLVELKRKAMTDATHHSKAESDSDDDDENCPWANFKAVEEPRQKLKPNQSVCDLVAS